MIFRRWEIHKEISYENAVEIIFQDYYQALSIIGKVKKFDRNLHTITAYIRYELERVRIVVQMTPSWELFTDVSIKAFAFDYNPDKAYACIDWLIYSLNNLNNPDIKTVRFGRRKVISILLVILDSMVMLVILNVLAKFISPWLALSIIILLWVLVIYFIIRGPRVINY